MLGVTSGSRVTFIVDHGTVRLVNAAVYAMQMAQQGMAGEGERAGLKNDDDVMALIHDMRREGE